MHLLSVILASAFLVFTECLVTEEEAEAASAELRKQFNYGKDIEKQLQDIKKEVKAKPDYMNKAYGVTKALAEAAPKLKSDDGLVVTQGVLTILAAVAQFFPPPVGIFITSIAGTISFVLALLTPAKANNILTGAIKGMINAARDKDLKYDLESYRSKLISTMWYLEPKEQQTLDRFDLSDIITHVQSHTGTTYLSKLANYIKERSTSSNTEEAKRAFQFCVLYVQIATFRDSVLQKVINLFKKAGHDGGIASYENVKFNNIEHYQKALQFLHQPTLEQAGTVVHYYPPGHSTESALIKSFMKAADISDPIPFRTKRYVLRSVKWPSYFIKVIDESSLMFSYGPAKFQNKIEFHERKDGYWELSYMGLYLYAYSNDNPRYIRPRSTPPGSDKLGHFVIVKYKNIVTISCRKWPNKFFGGKQDSKSVIFTEGNKDNSIQYYLQKCNNVVLYKDGAYCSDFKKEDGYSRIDS